MLHLAPQRRISATRLRPRLSHTLTVASSSSASSTPAVRDIREPFMSRIATPPHVDVLRSHAAMDVELYSFRQFLTIAASPRNDGSENVLVVDWPAVERWLRSAATRNTFTVHESDLVDALRWHPAVSAAVWASFVVRRHWKIHPESLRAAIDRATRDGASLDCLDDVPLSDLPPEQLSELLTRGVYSRHVFTSVLTHEILHDEAVDALVRCDPTASWWHDCAVAIIRDEKWHGSEAVLSPRCSKLLDHARAQSKPLGYQLLLQNAVQHAPTLHAFHATIGFVGATSRLSARTLGVVFERLLHLMSSEPAEWPSAVRNLVKECHAFATTFAVLCGLLCVSPRHALSSTVRRFAHDEIARCAATAASFQEKECLECGHHDRATCVCPEGPAAAVSSISSGLSEQLRCVPLDSQVADDESEVEPLLVVRQGATKCQQCRRQLISHVINVECLSCGARQLTVLDRMLDVVCPVATAKALAVEGETFASTQRRQCGAPGCGHWLCGDNPAVCGRCGALQDPENDISTWRSLVCGVVSSLSRASWDYHPIVRFVALLRVAIENKLVEKRDALQREFSWLHASPTIEYVRHLVHRVVELANDTSLSAFDGKGSDLVVSRHIVLNGLLATTLDFIELMNATAHGDMIGFETLLLLRRTFHPTEGEAVRDLRIVYLVQMRLTRSDLVGPKRCPQCVGFFGKDNKCHRCATSRATSLTERLQTRGLQMQIAAVQPRPQQRWMVHIE